MGKVTLITGDSGYSRLIKEFLPKDDITVVLSENIRSQEQKEKSPEKEKPGVTELNWNKRSPLSSRNAILTIINRFARVDSAVLVFRAGEFNKTFHEMTSAVYDLQVDRWIKGYGYLLKELIQLYIKQKTGSISIILDSAGLKIMNPVDGAVFNYLKSLGQNLSVFYQNESIRIYTFETDSLKKDAFMEFYFKTLNDAKYSPGKLLRFSDRKSLFDFGRSQDFNTKS